MYFIIFFRTTSFFMLEKHTVRRVVQIAKHSHSPNDDHYPGDDHHSKSIFKRINYAILIGGI